MELFSIDIFNKIIIVLLVKLYKKIGTPFVWSSRGECIGIYITEKGNYGNTLHVYNILFIDILQIFL